jgi:hypothetical protein
LLRINEPGFLGCTIEAPDGDVRCSPQEADELDALIGGITRTDTHGFGATELVLPRPEGDDGYYAADRIKRWQYAPVRVWDEANRTVYEGRIVKPQAGATEITLECEGLSKHAEDDETAREIVQDLDLNEWDRASAAERIYQIQTGGRKVLDPAVSTDTGSPRLELLIEDNWTGASPICDALYNARSVPLGSIYYSFRFESGDSGFVAILEVRNQDASSGGSADSTSDLITAGAVQAATGTLDATAADRTFASIRFYYASAGAGAAGSQYLATFPILAVRGRHGLTPRGTPSATNPGGFFVSDITPYLARKYAPLWNITTRSIEPTSFVVPHWVRKEDTTLAEMLDSLMLFGGNTFLPLDWAIWENAELLIASPDNHGRVWRIRLDEAAEQEDAGDDATTRVNGVKMTYTDGAGTEHSVGPPGSRSEVETTALLDTSPTNPVNRAKGADRKWRKASMGITYLEGATLMARVVMADANRQRWSGDMRLKGTVREQGAGSAEEPVYMVRTFDRGVIEDDPDTSERRITATAYDIRSRVNTVTVGTPPEHFPTLAARAGVVLEGLV